MSTGVAFALAYVMSYLFRSANAVISPELTRELALDPASLGLLTSAYFLAFGLMQVPRACCSIAMARGASSPCCSRSPRRRARFASRTR
jgi:sugar phosphate permease